MPDKEASAHQDSLSTEGSLPFFARFLEGQDNTERSAVTNNAQTLKYPSDRDEWDPFMNS
ncbi:MAG TPA: microviridin/marinostatin family tricyclic proteinase inhibitor [Pyrinomonadaceae bacterium]|nr:microviridin/marinostatin family tricyclic proteinase inhibitor [Pyrinomonadaceae bacterium]